MISFGSSITCIACRSFGPGHFQELLGSLKQVMQEALSDSHLYKSAMHGVANSLNPLHSETLGKMFNRNKSPSRTEG